MSDIEQRVKKIVAKQFGADEADVKNASSFVDDLGAGPLDTVELVMALEEEFDCEIRDEEAEKITTVQLAIDYFKNLKIDKEVEMETLMQPLPDLNRAINSTTTDKQAAIALAIAQAKEQKLTTAANVTEERVDKFLPKVFFEDIRLHNGDIHTRFKSDLFYFVSIISFISGCILVLNDRNFGAFLVLTASPFFLLYPLVRFLFGGKGGLLPAAVTFVAQEVIKTKIKNSLDKHNKRN